ncbi:phosphate ABC transporter substrate-binding protein, PhoT family (TC 3.A.1.7.1) [Tessaracoccus bendigoensis DSM 12906]|uniref:Phosphate-binding protein n=1 Tax=Tessaracoccus bendigoensis DSM 12906 TaxID=1123357 RepID=A0A1M6E9Y4_9ACTN|nr:phosphate ABC transporter substrate-binding protein PstS [Tessaracoccus bendigoensis]SHI82088.1 phosphate ABC transporter substrate-binding protein, PhoT family (TC 3.A.1.7.1) [Tessaracoccus bendigoensis DSM 12906]
MKIRLTAALGLSAVLLFSACAANETPADTATGSSEASAPTSTLEGTLSGKGASSAKVAQETWVAAFQTANPGVTVNYSPDGSGAGREAFIAGGADFAGSDRALKIEENTVGAFVGCAAESAAINVPIYVSPIAVIFNIEGVTDLNLTPEVLAGIFHGDITNWNDPAIAALNPDATLPDLAITAVHRSDESGTTENFTDYLHVAAAGVWTDEPSQEWPVAGGEAAKGTSGVVAAVTNGTGTIGYADASQAGTASIAKVGPEGKFEAPTEEAAATAVENSPVEEGREANDIAIALDRQAEGYPIVLVSYGIACSEYKDAAKGELVSAYLSYVVSEEGQQAAAASAGSAPLSATLRDKVVAAVDSIK